MALEQQEFEKLKTLLSSKDESGLRTGTRTFLQKALPVVGMIGGGIGGGILGAGAGGAGAIPGAVAGAGAGGALGEFAAQKLGGEEISSKEIIKTGVESSVSELAGQGLVGGGIKVLKWAGKEISPLVDIAKSGLQGIKKVLPGISEKTSETIAKYPDEVEKLAKEAEMSLSPIIQKVKSGTEKFAKSISDNYQKAWNKLVTSGEKYSFDNAKSVQSINNFIAKEAEQGKVYFQRTAKGLDFTNYPFTEKQAKDVVTKIVREVETAKPANIGEIRALKQRINAIYREYSSQLGKSPELDRFVTNMTNAVDEGLPPKLKEISKKYSQGLRFLDKVEEVLLPTSAQTGLTKTGTVGKIRGLGKEEIQDLFPDFLNEFKKLTKVDLTKELDIFNAAKEINPNMIPQDVGGFIRGIQKAANPVIGQIKIKLAKGEIPGQELFNSLLSITPKAEPLVNFLKDTSIPIATKIGIFESLQELFNAENP